MDTKNTSAIKVRLARADDLPTLVTLHVEAVAQLAADPPAGFRGDAGAAPDASQLENEFTAALGSADQELLVAEIDGRIVGSVLGTIEEFSDELIEAPFMTVQYVAVEPAARGRGVAQALLKELEHIARERGLSVLELRVWSNNRAAIELYVRQGYEVLEQRMAKRLR